MSCTAVVLPRELRSVKVTDPATTLVPLFYFPLRLIGQTEGKSREAGRFKGVPEVLGGLQRGGRRGCWPRKCGRSQGDPLKKCFVSTSSLPQVKRFHLESTRRAPLAVSRNYPTHPNTQETAFASSPQMRAERPSPCSFFTPLLSA